MGGGADHGQLVELVEVQPGVRPQGDDVRCRVIGGRVDRHGLVAGPDDPVVAEVPGAGGVERAAEAEDDPGRVGVEAEPPDRRDGRRGEAHRAELADLAGAALGEPEVAVRAGRDAGRLAVGRGDRGLGDDARGGDPTDLVGPRTR